MLNSAGTNAELGQGHYLIAEADESDASFLRLQPMTAVITNIDQDHMATYGHSFTELKKSFVEFVARLPFYGAVAMCVDDAEARALIPMLTRRVITYGTDEAADYRASNIRVDGKSWHFDVDRGANKPALRVRLGVPGQHNVMNALAAIAIATDEGIADDAIVQGLGEFAGVDRRFEISASIDVSESVVTLVDDYGHHPTEVEAVISTARQIWPERRLVMVYQPHRFSRTNDLFDDFVRVLSTVDVLLLLDVYAAGEKPIDGADSRALIAAIRQRGQISPVHAKDTTEAMQLLPNICQTDDVLLVQGAGNVSALSKTLRGLSD
jgi:UDP-N-acetylmuramate--alanine ligase